MRPLFRNLSHWTAEMVGSPGAFLTCAARTRLVHLEDLTDDELSTVEQEFQRLNYRLHKKPLE